MPINVGSRKDGIYVGHPEQHRRLKKISCCHDRREETSSTRTLMKLFKKEKKFSTPQPYPGQRDGFLVALGTASLRKVILLCVKMEHWLAVTMALIRHKDNLVTEEGQRSRGLETVAGFGEQGSWPSRLVCKNFEIY